MLAATDDDGVCGPVALDVTPLLGPPSGIGRYVRGLVDHLPDVPGAPITLPVTTSLRRGAGGLGEGGDRPAGAPAPRSLRVPAALWRPSVARGARWVDLALRPARLWHMTNFVGPRPRGLPYVMTVHDLAFLHLPTHVSPASARLRELVPLALAGASAVVTVSDATRDDLLDAYPGLRAPVVTIPLGVDPVWSGSATQTPPGEPYYVAVGTREPRKNLGLLLRAHARARREDPAVPPLVLVGRHGWGEDLDGETATPGAVRCEEDADDGRLVELVRGATALLAPSLREGFSLPVLEAMACGTPVLASDIPAHRELVGPTAPLLPAADEDAWAHALLAPAGTGTDVGPALERAAAYTWQRTADGHAALWRRLLDERSP